MNKNVLNIIILTLFASTVFSQYISTIESDNWKLSLRKGGIIENLIFKETNTKIAFNDNEFSGPTWYLQIGDSVIVPAETKFIYNKIITNYDDLSLSFEYKNDHGKLLIQTTVKNNGHQPFQPTKLGLRLGLDTYMDNFPDWEDKLFPTLLRCEKTHFWGYLMSPVGKILVVASPDAIASWSHEYSKSWGTPPYQYEGHRITSVNLDFINASPLPERHPQNMWQLKPGESKTFRIYLDEVDNLGQIEEKVSKLTGAPVISMDMTSCKKGDIINFSIYSKKTSSVEISVPDGSSYVVKPSLRNDNQTFYSFYDTKIEGLYHIKASSENGKKSEATFYVRKPYSWYMKNAMKAVVDYPQKASKSHCESWYGFYTAYAGGKYFPNNKNLRKADKQFNKILPLVFDTIKFEPYRSKHRIQNISSMIGILVDRYNLYAEENDIRKAVKLSDQLLKSQTPDGAYRAGETHYTSVIYIAKSLMELTEALTPLKDNQEYKESYDKIYNSVKLAMDELERNRTDIQTEGEQTFEDGMISCSALQLGKFALLQTDKKERDRYKDAALYFLEQHNCLEQLLIPDARMRSATLRFWEAQYDVVMSNNFFNSPHGWSSWVTYANYYAYLLTGDNKYLVRTFNGLDAAMQMIDITSGKLRWAFMVNPYLKVTQISKNIEKAEPLNFPGVHYHAKRYNNNQFIAGEQYVDMVSDWFFANSNDNDVHEHFKCLEEVTLNKAFISEKEDGKFITYNCTITKKEDKIIIKPNEDIIEKVHINVKRKTLVEVKFTSKTVSKVIKPGMTWISY